MTNVYAECEQGVWYLRTPIGGFTMLDGRTARSIARFIDNEYEHGKRDKVLELREALHIYDELYDGY